jgi:copper(I)-binding protein
MQVRSLFIFTIAAICGSPALAHDYTIGALHVQQPVARPSFPGQPSGAAYVSIENNGKQADKLVGVSTPIAASAQIHTMTMVGNVMKMREVDGIELEPSGKIAMQPGNGYHIMLMGLKQPLKVGDQFPMTLMFEKAGKLKVSVDVKEIKPGMQMRDKPVHQ